MHRLLGQVRLPFLAVQLTSHLVLQQQREPGLAFSALVVVLLRLPHLQSLAGEQNPTNRREVFSRRPASQQVCSPQVNPLQAVFLTRTLQQIVFSVRQREELQTLCFPSQRNLRCNQVQETLFSAQRILIV